MAGGFGAIASIAGTGASLFGELQAQKKQAEVQAKAASYEAWNNFIEAQQARTKAHQTNTAMTQKLMNITDNIRAVRAMTGTVSGSPGGEGILLRTKALGDQDTRRAVEDLMMEAEMKMAAHYFYLQVANDA